MSRMRFAILAPLCGALACGVLVAFGAPPMAVTMVALTSLFLAGVSLLRDPGLPIGWALAWGSLLAFAILLPAQAAESVVAAPAPGLTIPWGDWLVAALEFFKADLWSLALLGIAFVARKLPGQMGAVLETAQVEALLKRASDYGIAAVEGAAHGKAAELPIANAVVNEALGYAVSMAPGIAAKYADTLRARIVAHVAAAGVVPAQSSAALLGVQVTQ